MNQTQNNLATLENAPEFIIPATEISNEFSKEELAEDMEGISLSFQRVKVPAGGVLQFELPGDDPEHPEYAGSLTGVIVHHHDANGYWPGGMSDEDKAPLCFSADGKCGVGDPGGLCSGCGLNRFGSAEDGKGKACKNMHTLYLLRSGEPMPIMLNLPPTSLKPFRDFMRLCFQSRLRASYGSVVEIGLKRMDNGNPYSVATFRKVKDFAGEELAQIKTYTMAFKEQARLAQAERTKAAVEQRDDACDYTGFSRPIPDQQGGQFEVRGTVNGEKDELPL